MGGYPQFFWVSVAIGKIRFPRIVITPAHKNTYLVVGTVLRVFTFSSLQVFHSLPSNINVVIVSVYQRWTNGFLKPLFYMFPYCG